MSLNLLNLHSSVDHHGCSKVLDSHSYCFVGMLVPGWRSSSETLGHLVPDRHTGFGTLELVALVGRIDFEVLERLEPVK